MSTYCLGRTKGSVKGNEYGEMTKVLLSLLLSTAALITSNLGCITLLYFMYLHKIHHKWFLGHNKEVGKQPSIHCLKLLFYTGSHGGGLEPIPENLGYKAENTLFGMPTKGHKETPINTFLWTVEVNPLFRGIKCKLYSHRLEARFKPLPLEQWSNNANL